MIADASAAFYLRTRGGPTTEEMLTAFQHAVRSVQTRPTAIGVTVLERVALGTGDQLGLSFRTQAVTECERILDGGIEYATLYEGDMVEAYTTLCRAALMPQEM